MYFQNALISIETAKNNEINYAFYIKFILRQQTFSAQHQASLDNRGTGSLSGSQIPTAVQSQNESLNDSTDTQSLQGGDESSNQALVMDFP